MTTKKNTHTHRLNKLRLTKSLETTTKEKYQWKKDPGRRNLIFTVATLYYFKTPVFNKILWDRQRNKKARHIHMKKSSR